MQAGIVITAGILCKNFVWCLCFVICWEIFTLLFSVPASLDVSFTRQGRFFG
ncbi:hypothetical protein MPTK1_2g24310 [Marchantia polymorpha subsp. ruderalis]|uniref:Uncharacterized protein n=1 Tax=Marchantia polymorpha TaxID=3197 RepID=A0A2R6WPG4_MARPO|nr:hypothetical protein MARPO_0069s0080 [Marchantia polymorpha]BBN03539.1 hypothetical protein Mp_2g24310 [Marchantia polymorpha subsp. ruderalis]|eukprot:PTQ35745.1 hypothetical protein MARPO_0069s0080 [Marchantia polymorpha]